MQRSLRDLGRIRHRRHLSAHEFGAQRRQIFGLVGEFRSQCGIGAEVELLAETLDEIIKTAAEGIERGTHFVGGKSAADADMARCLLDLEQLLRDLRTRNSPPTHELDHAMDALIVHFVCADTERGDGWLPPYFISAKTALKQ
jgi:hypothetical protein